MERVRAEVKGTATSELLEERVASRRFRASFCCSRRPVIADLPFETPSLNVARSLYPERKAFIDVDRVLSSDDWTTLRDRIEGALATEGCPR